MYRKIQKLGLQVAYNDPENTEVKDFVYLTGALTLVPVGDVRRIFRLLKAAAPANMSDTMIYWLRLLHRKCTVWDSSIFEGNTVDANFKNEIFILFT